MTLKDVGWVWEGQGLHPQVEPTIFGVGEGQALLHLRFSLAEGGGISHAGGIAALLAISPGQELEDIEHCRQFPLGEIWGNAIPFLPDPVDPVHHLADNLLCVQRVLNLSHSDFIGTQGVLLTAVSPYQNLVLVVIAGVVQYRVEIGEDSAYVVGQADLRPPAGNSRRTARLNQLNLVVFYQLAHLVLS